MSTNLSDSNENMLVEYRFLFVYNSASKSSILHTMAFEFDIEQRLEQRGHLRIQFPFVTVLGPLCLR